MSNVIKTANEIQVGDVVSLGGGNWLRVEQIRTADNKRKLMFMGHHANGRGDADVVTWSKNVKKTVRV